MAPWILILIVIVVVVVAAIAMRKKAPESLPAPREEPKPLPSGKAKEPTPGPGRAAETKVAEAKAEPAESKPMAPGAAEDLAARPTEPAVASAAKAEVPTASAPTVTAAPIASDPSALIAALGPSRDESTASRRISVPPPGGAKAEDEAAALRKGLVATRGGFFARIKDLFAKKPELDATAIDELEEILLSSDVGVRTTQSLIGKLRAQHEAGQLGTSTALDQAMRTEAKTILRGGSGAIALSKKPSVLLFVGVNGVGKTTTIGKLASKLKDEGKRVLLVAGDTYRAAAVIQLEAWSRRVGCDVAKGKDRADPSGVIFDAVKRGIDEGYDVVLCDTAGRLQTKTPLMDELAKIGRSVEKALGRAPDETLLVLDATTGQNAIQQATQFGSTLPLSGIVLTKLDGTAKGGVILGIVDEQKVPVRYVGIGERVEDLRPFDAEAFVDALFDPQSDA